MRIIDKYQDLAKFIRRIAFDSFCCFNITLDSVDTLMRRLSIDYKTFDVNDISNDNRKLMFEFYNKLVKFYRDNESDLIVVGGIYINEEEHLNKFVTFIKKLAIGDVFVKSGDSSHLNFDNFYSIIEENFIEVRLKKLSYDEITKLFGIYKNMYWFNKGIMHENSDMLCLPNFMFNEIS